MMWRPSWPLRALSFPGAQLESPWNLFGDAEMAWRNGYSSKDGRGPGYSPQLMANGKRVSMVMLLGNPRLGYVSILKSTTCQLL